MSSSSSTSDPSTHLSFLSSTLLSLVLLSSSSSSSSSSLLSAVNAKASSPSLPSSSLSPPPLPSSSSSPSSPAKKRDTGLKHMIAGSIAGMAAKTILQPLDLVKVRLQVQDGKGANEYRGMFHAIQRVTRDEGFFGLYKGLTPNLLSAGVSWGVYFFSYNHFKDFFRRKIVLNRNLTANEHVTLGPLTHLSCAAASGVLATTLTNPIVMVKTRLQLQGKEQANAHFCAVVKPLTSGIVVESKRNESRHYTGMIDAFGRIIREEGFFSLYRGLGPSLVLVSNGSLQFMAYEELKELAVQYLVGSEEKLAAHHYFLMGGLAKIFSATITYPFAVTRSRLFARKPVPEVSPPSAVPIAAAASVQMNVTATLNAPVVRRKDAKYNGMLDAMQTTWRNEGIRGFYKGLTPQLLKTAPSSAITFLIYETIVKLIDATTAKELEASKRKESDRVRT